MLNEAHLNGVSRSGFAGALHAHVLMIVLRWEFGAVEGSRPWESEALEYRVAARPYLLAQPSARADRRRHLLRAHGRVHRAQEQVQLGTANYFFKFYLIVFFFF